MTKRPSSCQALLLAFWAIGFPCHTGCGDQEDAADPTRRLSHSGAIAHGISTHRWSTLVTPGPDQAKGIGEEVTAYETAVDRKVAWVAFGHEWETDGPAFPMAVATSIRERGATPFIYLTLRTVDNGKDPVYDLASIIAGKYDAEFASWADQANKFGSELIADWGWEMNGDWNWWNGTHNGGPTQGPRRFREAYRHIVEVMRKRGASNIKWVFHANFPESPSEAWNAFENYYPGDDVIDATGFSIYGPYTPEDKAVPFAANMDQAYSRIVAMAPDKPVYMFEFAASARHPSFDVGAWADDALEQMLSGRWPQLRGLAWWNDYGGMSDTTETRVEAVPRLTEVFRRHLSKSEKLKYRPPVF